MKRTLLILAVLAPSTSSPSIHSQITSSPEVFLTFYFHIHLPTSRLLLTTMTQQAWPGDRLVPIH